MADIQAHLSQASLTAQNQRLPVWEETCCAEPPKAAFQLQPWSLHPLLGTLNRDFQTSETLPSTNGHFGYLFVHS